MNGDKRLVLRGKEMRTYKEILSDVSNSCNKVFYAGHKDIQSEVIEAATKIYIAELQLDYCREIDKKYDDKMTKRGERVKCNPVDDYIGDSFKGILANKMCKSESDHEWECCGIGTDGSTFRCKKCGAYKKYPLQCQEVSITI